MGYIDQQKSLLTYQLFSGKALEVYLPLIQKVHAEKYKEYPDFYSSREDDFSFTYTSFYLNVSQSFMVGVFHKGQLIGWAIGLPFNNLDVADYYAEGQKVIPSQERFKDFLIDVDTCFYANEVLVLPAYHQQGIEDELFKRFEEGIKKTKKYDHLGWFHLDLGNEHPRRPKGFVDFDKKLLQTHGFAKTNYAVMHAWDVIQPDGSILEQQNFMLDFWVKRI